ncbi:MAG: Ig-like domain-containing protein [Lachnospiraceae bacterium]|nr:Ig-like domain-containing protein [Lachnospiraceae bacterium]
MNYKRMGKKSIVVVISTVLVMCLMFGIFISANADDGQKKNSEPISLKIGEIYNFYEFLLYIGYVNEGLTFFSSNPNVAKVDSDGIVTALSEGSATITAKRNDVYLQDSCLVTVNTSDPQIDDINDVNPTGITMTLIDKDGTVSFLIYDRLIDGGLYIDGNEISNCLYTVVTSSDGRDYIILSKELVKTLSDDKVHAVKILINDVIFREFRTRFLSPPKVSSGATGQTTDTTTTYTTTTAGTAATTDTTTSAGTATTTDTTTTAAATTTADATSTVNTTSTGNTTLTNDSNNTTKVSAAKTKDDIPAILVVMAILSVTTIGLTIYRHKN